MHRVKRVGVLVGLVPEEPEAFPEVDEDEGFVDCVAMSTTMFAALSDGSRVTDHDGGWSFAVSPLTWDEDDPDGGLVKAKDIEDAVHRSVADDTWLGPRGAWWGLALRLWRRRVFVTPRALRRFDLDIEMTPAVRREHGMPG